MKIKQTLSWLKAAVVAAIVMGGGSAALASSPPPWTFDFGPGSGASERLENSKEAYQEMRSPFGAYQILRGLEGDREIMFWRAWYASKAGFIDEAENIYRNLIAIEPDSARHLNALGFLLATNKYSKLDEAAELLELALEIEPGNPVIIHSYGRVFEMRGEREIAKLHYEKAADLLDYESLDYLDLSNEYLFELPISYGGVLLATGDDAGFENLVAQIQRVEGVLPVISLSLRMMEGVYKNKIDNELTLLIEILNTLGDDDDPGLKALYALMLHRAGDLAEAKTELKAAESRLGQYSSFEDVRTYSFVLREVGATSETESALQRLIASEPENPLHYSTLGYVMADGGNPSSAIWLLEKALELAPERPEILSSYAWALHKGGKSVEAAIRAEKALDHRPGMEIYAQVAALVEYGEILSSLGFEEKAREIWDRAISMDDNHVKVLAIIDQRGL